MQLSNEQIFECNAARLALEKKLTQITGRAATVNFELADGAEPLPEQKPVVAKKEDVWRILKAVSECYGLEQDVILGSLRRRPIPEARFMTWKLIKEMYPGTTLAFIGEAFDKDHSTIINGMKQLDNWLSYDREVKANLRRVLQVLGQ